MGSNICAKCKELEKENANLRATMKQLESDLGFV
jgi:hypothetical protein